MPPAADEEEDQPGTNSNPAEPGVQEGEPHPTETNHETGSFVALCFDSITLIMVTRIC